MPSHYWKANVLRKQIANKQEDKNSFRSGQKCFGRLKLTMWEQFFHWNPQLLQNSWILGAVMVEAWAPSIHLGFVIFPASHPRWQHATPGSAHNDFCRYIPTQQTPGTSCCWFLSVIWAHTVTHKWRRSSVRWQMLHFPNVRYMCQAASPF